MKRVALFLRHEAAGGRSVASISQQAGVWHDFPLLLQGLDLLRLSERAITHVRLRRVFCIISYTSLELNETFSKMMEEETIIRGVMYPNTDGVK